MNQTEIVELEHKNWLLLSETKRVLNLLEQQEIAWLRSAAGQARNPAYDPRNDLIYAQALATIKQQLITGKE